MVSLDAVKESMYNNRELYSCYPESPPPEEKIKALKLELSTGCPWSKCNYCTIYEEQPHTTKTVKEFRKHLNAVKTHMRNEGLSDYDFRRIRKVFLSGGDAFYAPTRTIKGVLKTVRDSEKDFGYIEKISMYASTMSINKKTREEMRDLRNNDEGLYLIYWGVESGSDKVLEFCNKAGRKKHILKAAEIAKRGSGPRPSVMVMPGLGGIKYFEEHALETAEVVNAIYPRFLTFMTVKAPNTSYARKIAEDKNNRPLTPFEIGQQMKLMMENIDTTKHSFYIASEFDETTPVANNPLKFNSRHYRYSDIMGKIDEFLECCKLFGLDEVPASA